MKVKSILVSQPQPKESFRYHELGKRNKIKIDFRQFIHVEGVSAKDVRQQKIDFSNFTAVIFTSRNVVDHYFRLAEEMRFRSEERRVGKESRYGKEPERCKENNEGRATTDEGVA